MTVIETIAELDLSYKGEREYLHSTDIFNEVFKKIKSYEELVMVIHRKMTSALYLIPFNNLTNKKDFSACIYYKNQGSEYCLGILADESKPIIKRYAYDEPQVIMGFRLYEKTITLLPLSQATFIDYVVALNKKLVEFTVSNKIKWAFTKLELYKIPKIGLLKLYLENNVGTKLTKSSIYVDGVFFGYIYFSDFAKAYE